MGYGANAQGAAMTPQLEIAVGVFFLAIGSAGPPLEPLRIALAALLCVAVWRSGRFAGALAMLVTIAGGFLQHGQFRLTTLFAAAIVGIATHFFYRRPRAATAIMGVSAVAGIALLFFG